MNDEKFKLNNTNRFLIAFAIVLTVCLLFAVTALVFSLKDTKDPIPDLNIVKGKTSTLVATSKKTNETTTESTTTLKTNVSSPYYDIDIDKILDDPLFTTNSVRLDDAKKIVEMAFNVLDSFYNIINNSIIDSNSVSRYVKDGEKDLITIDNNKYVIIYKSNELINRIFSESAKYFISKTTFNDKKIIINQGEDYYRLFGIPNNSEMVFVSLDVSSVSQDYIDGSVKFYDKNYRENGYTAPQYKTTDLNMHFENGRWKVYKFTYPLYGE